MSDRVDVKSWLAVNKLSYVEKIFVERNIAVEELVDFDTDELKDFAKDLKLDALATRRFIKAIEDQKAYSKGGKPTPVGPVSVSSYNDISQKPLEMHKSVSEGSDVPGDNSEDVAPPEAAFGMPQQYLVANPMEGMNQEGQSEGEGGGEGAIEKDIPSIGHDININSSAKVNVIPTIHHEKIIPGNEYISKGNFEPQKDIAVVRQSSSELRMKGGIQGKDDKMHIIVTPFEQEALVKLQDRLDLVESLIDGIQSSFDKLDNRATEVKKDIRDKVEFVINVLKEKTVSVGEEAKNMQNQKATTLKSQAKYLADHQIAMNSVKKRYEELIADASKDVHERRVEIVTMCTSVFNDRNVLLSMATTPNVKFGFQMDSVKGFCRKLTIDDCDQPVPPSQVRVEDVTSESAKLYWKMMEFAETKPVLEYGIEVALLPETERIPESDDTQKDKKSDKDSQKKKKKSKKDSSDEESDETEESESESESDSDSSGGKKKRKKNKKDKKGDKKGDKKKGKGDGEMDILLQDDVVGVKLGAIQEVRPSILLKKYPDLQWKQIVTLELTGKNAKKVLKSISKESGNFSHVVQGLKEYMPYLIRIRARNESGWSHYSPCLRFQTKKVYIKSKILKAEEKKLLIEWLPKKERQYPWQLLYQASKSAYSAYTFHQKCDNKKGSTVVIVKTTTGHVFGGYTTLPWTSTGGYRMDPKAFIFKLREPKMNTSKWKKNLKTQQKTFGKNWKIPGKFECHNATNSLNHTSSYGPTFGGGHDFYLCHSCNTSSSSYSNAGNSYNCPRSNIFLAGVYNFLVKEYEVFLIKKPKRK